MDKAQGTDDSHTPRSQTILGAAATAGLAEIQILHPPGTFALTPASRIAVRAIGQHHDLLAGTGLDWGSGTGCLAVTAAKIARVDRVIGLEISLLNVATAQQNALLNGVADKTLFLHADSYVPFAAADQTRLAALRGQTDFIVANPPSSEGDDGFAYRRVVLRGARPFLKPGGIVFLNISYQYGSERIGGLCAQIPEFRHGGVLASTAWVPFDLQRADLNHALALYAAEERRGGPAYTFANPEAPDIPLNAQEALAAYARTGLSPLSKWQTHLFRFVGA